MKDRVGKEISVGDLIMYGRYAGDHLNVAKVIRINVKECSAWQKKYFKKESFETLSVRTETKRYVPNIDSHGNKTYDYVQDISKRLVTLSLPERILVITRDQVLPKTLKLFDEVKMI